MNTFNSTSSTNDQFSFLQYSHAEFFNLHKEKLNKKASGPFDSWIIRNNKLESLFNSYNIEYSYKDEFK